MEHQNDKPINHAKQGEASGGVEGNKRSRHRRNRSHGRGGRKSGAGQEIRTKSGNFITPSSDQSTGAERRDERNENRNGRPNAGKPAHEAGRGQNNDRRRNDTSHEQGVARDSVRQSVSPRVLPSTVLSASVEDKWLDDTFTPLHEVEIHDPEAEEHARHLLDEEGPLLFRQEPIKEQVSQNTTDSDEQMVEIVGVRFQTPGKIYYFAPGSLKLKKGSFAIVETARGEEYGEVCKPNERVAASQVVQPLRPVLRQATEQDARHHEENQQKEAEAFHICQGKIAEHGLEMKLVEAQYTFDNTKLLFYFTSDGRVDFRELVKDLAGVFRTRIELRQIGIRDEAKLLGGLGTCGRPLCCSGFLSDFVQVSIKMAKEQNLSLNSAKISGCCGRLMCCLRYEFDTYETEIRLTPPVGSVVETPDGRGEVTANHPLKGTVTVRLGSAPDEPPRTYHRDNVNILSRHKTVNAPKKEEEESEK